MRSLIASSDVRRRSLLVDDLDLQETRARELGAYVRGQRVRIEGGRLGIVRHEEAQRRLDRLPAGQHADHGLHAHPQQRFAAVVLADLLSARGQEQQTG
jgi:hypothetical protein